VYIDLVRIDCGGLEATICSFHATTGNAAKMVYVPFHSPKPFYL